MGRTITHPSKRNVGFSEGIDDESVALEFSKLQNLPQFKLIRKIPLKAVLEQKISEKTRILDLGCGSGHFLIDLHRILKRNRLCARLYGLDIAQTMLDRSQIHFNKKKVRGIKLILEDGVNIPVENEYFDVVSTSLSLHHWLKPEKVLAEIHRVTKLGGKFILFDLHRLASKGWFNFLKFITKHIVPKALRNVNEPYRSLQASYTKDEIVKFIKNTPWSEETYKISEVGPFIHFVFQKN